MRRSLPMVALFALLTSCASTARAQNTPAPREDLQKVYTDFLKQEGYAPSINADGNVAFKYEGGSYVIIIDPKDKNFFQLLFPGFWKFEGEEDRRRALNAANQAMMSTKVAKVWVTKTNVIATFELIVKDPSDISFFFRRALGGVRLAVKTFADEMNKKDDAGKK
ncbi:MAG TPA: hypothetical protein VML50_12590 [Anaeromyxobacter sp.]|nr:hypothetical protein [Anaeromyxobacter sp.]